MVSALGLVIVKIVFHKKWSVLINLVFLYYATAKFVIALCILLGTFGIYTFPGSIARIFVHGIKVAIFVYTAHVVHSRCDSSLDTRINSCGVEGNSAPTADTDDTYFIRVSQVTG